MPATLGGLARVVRSKNAGNFHWTFDILFDRPEPYRRVKESGALSPELFARLYGVAPSEVEVLAFDAGLGLKVTIPRPIPSGGNGIGETDLWGSGQYPPLLDLEIP
jgi:hypothetical protein